MDKEKTVLYWYYYFRDCYEGNPLRHEISIVLAFSTLAGQRHFRGETAKAQKNFIPKKAAPAKTKAGPHQTEQYGLIPPNRFRVIAKDSSRALCSAAAVISAFRTAIFRLNALHIVGVTDFARSVRANFIDYQYRSIGCLFA